MTYVTVRVVDSSGRPMEYARVSVWRGGIDSGFYPEQRTDRDGEAEFEVGVSSSDKICVYAEGQKLYDDYVKARITVVV